MNIAQCVNSCFERLFCVRRRSLPSFFSAGHTVLHVSINYSSAVWMSVIDGGRGLSALRMIDITLERRYVSNDPRSALQV